MANLVLRTFQPLSRVAQLQHDRTLIGDWGHVRPGNERAYARMVEVMTEHGISTDGRPPIWAWHGPLRLIDADLLFDPVHELSRGIATLTFRAPADLVLLCDYGHWCDALMAPAADPAQPWQPAGRTADSLHPEQACLPYLRREWVTNIKPLPVAGWDTLDLETPL